MAMTTIHVRIDKETKEEANEVLDSLGLDMSTAIKVFLSQVIQNQGLPFTPTRNPRTIRKEWDAETKEALRKGKSYRRARDMH